MNCTGKRCIMQYDKVDPAACTAVPYCQYATPPKTNADRIRTMSDEELTSWLTSISSFTKLRKECGYEWTSDDWRKWLKSEAPKRPITQKGEDE